MKQILFLILFLGGSLFSFAQSNSYQTFKNKFEGQPEVFSMGVSGFWCRFALNFAGDQEFKNAIKEVNHLRFITVPKTAFQEQGVSVNGFKKIIRDDKFEELAKIKERGEDVTFYLQADGNKNNRYLVLIEEPGNVVLIEMKGYIDPSALQAKKITLKSEL